MIKHLICGVLVWLSLAVCSAASNESSIKKEAFTLLGQGTQSGIAIQRFEIIRNEAAFQSIWQAHALVGSQPLNQPTVNFQTTMVIAAFAGTKPTSGYRIEITGISKQGQGENLEVTLMLTEPGPECFVSEVMTQPYVMMKTAMSSQSVHFTLMTKTSKCG
jgi:hypothetical protein